MFEEKQFRALKRSTIQEMEFTQLDLQSSILSLYLKNWARNLMIPRYPLLLLCAGTCQSCSLFSKWTDSSHPLCQHCPLGEISAPLILYNPSFYSSKSWFLCPFASDMSRATLIFSPFTTVVTISWTHLGIGQT